MKKVFAIFAFLTILLIQASGQTGNEWIDYNQTYYKIPTAQDGLYRLSYSDLQNAGVPVNSIDPKSFRIFHRGVEQSIYVDGESDEQFDIADYVEFYGRRNDGTLDAELYKPSSSQPHQLYNLYCDTTAFFLTFGGIDGKRMQSFGEANGGLPTETFQRGEKLRLTIEQYASGVVYGADVQQTFFDRGEGWMSKLMAQNQLRSFSTSGIVNTVTTGAKPQLEVMLVGRNDNLHQVEISIGSSPRLLGTSNFSSYAAATSTFPIEWSDIEAGGTVTVSVKPLNVSDWVSIAYFRVFFPQNFNAAGENQKLFTLRENTGGKSYIQIQNPGAGTQLYDVTDPANLLRIQGTLSGTYNAVIPNTTSSRKILAVATAITPELHKVSFRNINPSEHNYIILTHHALRVPAQGYSDPVESYAAYRASAAGGGYDTLVVNIQDVYDQFGYGELSPVGIFRLMRYLTNVNVPRYFFIIGKGLEVLYDYNRDQGAFTTYPDLVPSSGYPSSDNYFTAGLAGSTYAPAVPTGRLTASAAEQVAFYLNKVIETEAQPVNDQRRKNLLHLSGGIEEGEPERFKGYVNDFKKQAESYYLGGKVSSIAKRSRDITLISIANEVNAGLGLVTFFGHSSSNTLDFDIGYVTDPVMGYNNKGKYPMILIHGCNAGSFFIDDFLFGEDWILAKDKGAIGFIAHSYYGLEQNLKKYGDTFYSVAYQDSSFIYKGVGNILKEVSRKYMVSSPHTESYITQAQQMILLGDPAVALFGAKKSDLEVNSNTVSFESFDGEPITALTDSFKVSVVVRNFGQARPDTFRIEVERIFNDNTSVVTDSIVRPVLYSDTIVFTIRKGREAGFGNNVFKITVDADDLIDELSETNNVASRELFIPLNGTKNLFPRNFAIVNTTEPTLSWQTTDIFSEIRTFELELDTVNTFDSPYKKTFSLAAKVLAQQSVDILSNDSTAYYWRTKLLNPLPGERNEWESSSFTYIAGSSDGWAQVHFPQYLDNGAEGLLIDGNLREIKFKETVTPVDIKTFGSDHAASVLDVSVKILGVEYNLYTQSYGGFGCRDNTINFVAFDKNSTTPYIGVPFKWYNVAGRACGREPWVINSFQPAEMVTGNHDDLLAYVDNIAPGDSVVMYSMGNAAFSLWPAAARIKLGELGISAAQLTSLTDGEPVVIYGKKGISPGAATIFRSEATSPAEELDVTGTITGRYSSGTMSSALVGPALAWESFHARYNDKEVQDDVHYDIIGVALNGAQTTLFSNVSGTQNLSGVDATEFPYMKVMFKSTDDLNLTSPQPDYWIVLYTPVPEGLITFFGPRETQAIASGKTWAGSYGFVNIGDREFSDSLSVRYETFNHTLGQLETNVMKIKAPAVGDTTVFSVDVNTTDKSGLNDVDVYVNPRIQPEQYYENNVMSLPNHLDVQKDFFNPVMDVMVDGRRLKEGDFVSVNPLIVVKVWDENRSLLKSDLTGMNLFLTYPCDQTDCDPTPIDLNAADVKWFAATETSDFRIEFRPNDLVDGYYILRVNAADANGNAGGTEPYQVGFVVHSAATVTILPPYPNPSIGNINFNVVLSGDALPEQFQLQIVDVTGKMIREYSPDRMHIGMNEWQWDGTDQNHSAVQPGVYVYKIFFTLNGKKYQKAFKVILLR